MPEAWKAVVCLWRIGGASDVASHCLFPSTNRQSHSPRARSLPQNKTRSPTERHKFRIAGTGWGPTDFGIMDNVFCTPWPARCFEWGSWHHVLGSFPSICTMRPDFKARSIGTVLERLIEEMGIGQKMDEARALEMWTKLAGEHINRHTTKKWIRNGRLFVQISSSVWRQDLHSQRSRWLRHLNNALGKEVVSEIVFR